MTDFYDPERAAAVRSALGRLLGAIAGEVARSLPVAGDDGFVGWLSSPAHYPDPAAGPTGRGEPAPRPRPGGLR